MSKLNSIPVTALAATLLSGTAYANVEGEAEREVKSAPTSTADFGTYVPARADAGATAPALRAGATPGDSRSLERAVREARAVRKEWQAFRDDASTNLKGIDAYWKQAQGETKSELDKLKGSLNQLQTLAGEVEDRLEGYEGLQTWINGLKENNSHNEFLKVLDMVYLDVNQQHVQMVRVCAESKDAYNKYKNTGGSVTSRIQAVYADTKLNDSQRAAKVAQLQTEFGAVLDLADLCDRETKTYTAVERALRYRLVRNLARTKGPLTLELGAAYFRHDMEGGSNGVGATAGVCFEGYYGRACVEGAGMFTQDAKATSTERVGPETNAVGDGLQETSSERQETTVSRDYFGQAGLRAMSPINAQDRLTLSVGAAAHAYFGTERTTTTRTVMNQLQDAAGNDIGPVHQVSGTEKTSRSLRDIVTSVVAEFCLDQRYCALVQPGYNVQQDHLVLQAGAKVRF